MSKLAVEINRGIRDARRTGQRGFPFPKLDNKGVVTGFEWRYPCYCLSVGLVKESSLCPQHGRIISHHPSRRPPRMASDD